MRKLLLILFALSAVSIARAYQEEPPEPSTAPIGSSFYRHLAFDFNLDLKEMVKFEKKGFGRGEIVTLVLLSKATGTPLKDYGKRRTKDKVLLKDLAVEAGFDYPTLYKMAEAVKEGIESKGDKNLPPPVYRISPEEAKKKADEAEAKKKKKKNKKGKEEPKEEVRESSAPIKAIAPAAPAPEQTGKPAPTPKIPEKKSELD